MTSSHSSHLPLPLPLTVTFLFVAATVTFAQTPRIGTINPAQASVGPGMSQTLTFTASFSPTAQPELDAQVTGSAYNAGCWFSAVWNSGSPMLSLHDGYSGGLEGSTYFGSGITVSDAVCQVRAQSYLFDSQGNVTVTVSVSFPSNFPSQTFVYNEMVTDFTSGASSGWLGMTGNYFQLTTISHGPPKLGTAIPANVSMQPNQVGTLQVTAGNPNGWSYADEVDVVISPSHAFNNACLIALIPAQGVMYLQSDDLSTQSPVWFGHVFATNSQCAVLGSGTTLSFDGTSLATSTNLTFTLNLAFFPSFTGPHNVDQYVLDTQFGTAGWGTIGTLTVATTPF
jgi:hypothetical protein